MLSKEFNMELALRASKYDGIEEGIESKEKDFVQELLKRSFSDPEITAMVKITSEKLEQYKATLKHA